MADIFLSYVRSDKKRAKQVADSLSARGWSVWWDAALTPGMRFRDKIAEELHAARCVVVLWSKASIASDFVVDEAEDGKRRGVLVQALIEDVRPPHGFRQIQAANLIGWDGRDAGEFARLCEGILRHVPAWYPAPLISDLAGDPPRTRTASGCTYTIDPSGASISARGGSGSVKVSTAKGCAWTATANALWITVTSGASGVGDGSVAFKVGANTGEARSGTLTIGGLSFEVTQWPAYSHATPEFLLKMKRRQGL